MGKLFDANKSTKGASKLRRDLINSEIANLRDLLPLPQSTRQRLSQLQLMALVCVYVRKANYFQQGLDKRFTHVKKRPGTTSSIELKRGSVVLQVIITWSRARVVVVTV
ncbi:conserved hypothetical protein [Culex quinquefasciatus]|uniref:BHLH domain-containing protein n=1 Tax=Culex quinquefasciatus TaxID=7176 RepID=B0WJB9_CULQU|nr:conserved hypothetical protein [Culex quinquefasciatus]|eukprot:XP_001848803.1 conserved hypothetical protein [Culex quinquefasciatus]